MAKKGILAIVKNDKMKTVYAHRNAQLGGFGKKIVKMCNSLSVEGLNKLYDNMIVVDEDAPMTVEQIQAYKNYIPEQLWKEDLTWTEALSFTKDATKPLTDGFPYAVDYCGFAPSWRCRFRYIIDLDNNMFQVAKAGLEMLCAESDEFLSTVDYMSKIEPAVIGRFPLDSIPEDWQEICESKWKDDLMLTTVDWKKDDPEAVAMDAMEDDIEAQHTLSKYRFYLGR